MSRSATSTRRAKVLVASLKLVQEARTMARVSKPDALSKLAEARRLYAGVSGVDTEAARNRTLSLFDQCEAAISAQH